MLGSLHGTVTGRLDHRTLIEVSGVGYWVFTGSWQPEGDVTCYLYHHVREEASDLYGFEHLADLQLFEKLLGISGIGPKAALALLSIGPATRISQAIQEKDVTFLSSAPGIGQKAAQKIVLELNDKLDSIVLLLADTNSPTGDLLAALISLGYKNQEIRPYLGSVPKEITSLNDQIKWVLSEVSKK